MTEESKPQRKTRTFRLKAAPKGKRSGLAVFSQGELSLSILVLPKRWTNKPQQYSLNLVEKDKERKKELSFTLHEKDSIDLHVEEEWWDFLDYFKKEIEFQARKHKKEEDTEEDLPEGIEKYNELIFIDSIKTPENLKGNEEYSFSEKDNFTSNFGNLLQLAMLSGQTDFKALKDKFSDRVQGYLIGPPKPQPESDPLKLMAQMAFIEEMKRLWRQLRQGYVPVTETLSFVRGRVTSRGIVQHMASGIPRLECNYDRFTDAIPLFRVLITALQEVARGTLLSNLKVQKLGTFSKLTDTASHLRNQLSHIPVLPRRTAIFQAKNLRLNRLESDWQTALDLAKVILTSHPPELRGREAGMSGLMWWVNTDKVWEKILEEMLRAARLKVDGEENVGTWIDVETNSGSRKRVDLIIQQGQELIVADAKYKDWRVTPLSEDQYQIFAYSLLYTKHLKTEGSRVKGTALIYPSYHSSEDNPHVRIGKSYRRAEINVKTEKNTGDDREKSRQVGLKTIQVPFPQPADLKSWNIFIKTHGRQLKDALFKSKEEGSEEIEKENKEIKLPKNKTS